MRRFGLLVSLGGAAILAGCVTRPAAPPPSAARPAEMRTVTVAGGESVRVPIEHGAARHAENSDVKIESAGFVADRAKQEIVFVFGFREKKMEWPRSVTVEDVTGDNAELLLTDTTPRLARDGTWKGTAAPLRKGDPGLAWLEKSGDTFKVFRLTIITADGRKLVMFQAAIWGAALKTTFRQMLGYESQAST
jgi:hypothetical protein